MRRALKAFGVGVALVLVGIFLITLVAVLAPLIFLAVVSYDVVDDVRQAWRSRLASKARTTEEWAALQRVVNAQRPPPAAPAAAPPEPLYRFETMEELAAFQRKLRARTRVARGIH